MGIDLLLALQAFRGGAGQWLAPVMNLVSDIAYYVLILIPILIFWNAGRYVGYWYLLNLGLSDYFINLIKVTACIPRPWIRDARVVPWEKSLSASGGYSFPSGHAASSAAILCSVGLRQRKKRSWLIPVSVFFVLLVAFSRLYLGVHTPQDVLAGIASALLVIAFDTWLIRHLKGNEKRQDLWTAFGFVFALLSLLYIELKGYPGDFPEVDVRDMMKNAYKSVGMILGFLAGSLWERKKIRFDARGTLKAHLVRSLVGTAGVALLYLVVRKVLVRLIGIKAGNLAGMFLLALFVTGICPWCVEKTRARMPLKG